MSVTFICGSHRSGTTSLLRIIDLSRETHCEMEPSPHLNLESRYMFEGFLHNPFEVVLKQIAPRVAAGLAKCSHYVEKQNSLVPFIPVLYSFFGCKFLITIRDGCDVVASMVNWHQLMYPIIYQECGETGVLSKHAQSILDAQQGMSEFDYSLPRPKRGDPCFDQWNCFSRFEMVSWYWNYINLYLAEILKRIPSDSYMIVDYTKPNVEKLHEVYRFLGLNDFDAERVKRLLERKVNSLNDRGENHRVFPCFPKWTPEKRQRFFELAWASMKGLGFVVDRFRPRPERYVPTLTSAVDDRVFKSWCDQISKGSELETMLISGDADLSGRPEGKAVNIVGYLGGLEGCHDIDAHLRIAASLSCAFLYVSAGGGYRGLMTDHRYLWQAEERMFRNLVSVRKATEVLREEGYMCFATMPGPNGQAIIIGSREVLSWDQLVAGHPIIVAWQQYVSKGSNKNLSAICHEINVRCHYLSVPPMDFANDLDYFKKISQDLVKLENLKAGKMCDFVAGRNNLGLRLDVDMDFVAFAGMVELAKKHQLEMSCYVLHTASYYGSWDGGIFWRNENIAGALRQFKTEGIEIGLHVDPYFFYREHAVDGAQAVRDELMWLQAQGLKVESVSGHNCASSYGAESSEIFRQWAIRASGLFCHDYVFAPVGELDAKALGIRYEAGGLAPEKNNLPPDENPFIKTPPPAIPVRDASWMRKYLLGNGYCRWAGDFKVWIIGKDSWVFAARFNEKEIFEFGVSWADILRFLNQMPLGMRGIMTLHPAYFGYRGSAGSMPIGMPLSAKLLCGLID